MNLTPYPEASHRAAADSAVTAELIEKTWDFQNPAASEAAFQALAEQRKQAGELVTAGELLTQMARAQGLQEKMSAASVTLDAVVNMLPDAPRRVEVRLLLERGRILNSSKEPEAARPYFERALLLARDQPFDDLAVDAAHMVAITYLTLPEQAVVWNETALGLARNSHNPRARRWLASLLNNQAWSYFDQRDFERALTLFVEALDARKQGTDERARRIADWCVARTLRALGRAAQALDIQRRLLAEHRAAGTSDRFVLEEIAECLLALGESENARGYFALAYAELVKDPVFAREEPERLARIARLGGIASEAAQKP